MKRCIFLSLSVILLLVNIGSFAAEEQIINFDQAVHLTLQSNPVVLENQASIEASRAGVKENRGRALPHLNMEVNAATSNNALNVFSYKLSQGRASFADFGFGQYTGPGSINTQPTALDHPGYYSNINNGFILDVPIYSGGKSIEKIRQSQYLLESAKAGSREAKAMLIYNLLQSYEGVITTNGILRNIQSSKKAAAQYLSMTKSLKSQSVVITGDVLLAKYNLRSQKTALQVAKAQKLNALNAFRILIGKPNSHFCPGNFVHLSVPSLASNYLTQAAFDSNEGLKAIEMKVKADKSEIKASKSHNLPSLDLELRHDWNAQDYSFSNPTNTALLQLSWQLFSSGAQTASDQKAAARYDQSYASESEALDKVRLSVLNTIQAIRTAKIELSESNKNIPELKEVVQSYKDRYGKGLLTLGQLLDAQNRLDQAKNEQFIARYRLILAKAKLLVLINQFHFSS